MKIKMIRRILRGIGAFALVSTGVGAGLGLAAQRASAAPNPTAHLYVSTAASSSDTTASHKNCGDGVGGSGAAHACLTVSHAVALADSLIQSGSANSAVIKVEAGTYYDTVANATCAPSCTTSQLGSHNSPPDAGISVTEPHITIEKTGSGTVTIEPQATENETSIEDTTPQNVLVYVAPVTPACAGSCAYAIGTPVTGFTLEGVTLNGKDAQHTFTAGSQDFVGVYFANSSGTLTTDTVENVQQPAAAFGAQPGADGDVYVVSCNPSSADELSDPCTNVGGAGEPMATQTSVVTITGGTYKTYDKTGISCDGANTTCNIGHNAATSTYAGVKVTGMGELNDQAQNGMQVAYGAKATIVGGTVSDNEYGCNGVANGSCYSASGIETYADGGVTVTSHGASDHATIENNDVNIFAVYDGGTYGTHLNVTSTTIEDTAAFADGDIGSGYGIVPEVTTSARIAGDTIENNPAGGVFDYSSTGTTITNNKIWGNSGSFAINTGYGVPATASEIGGGVTLYGSDGSTTTGNQFDQTATSCSSDPTDAGNANGGVIAQGATSGTNTVSDNTFAGKMGSGIDLDVSSGFSVAGNTICTDDQGPGIILAGSDDNTIGANGDPNTVSDAQLGLYVGGNDLTSASTGNLVQDNSLTGELAGAVADGFASPLTWNMPGGSNQGIQGEVFFQSDQTVSSGAISGTCTDAALETDFGGCVEAVDSSFVPPTSTYNPDPGQAYSAVASYLLDAAGVCSTDSGANYGSVPVDNDSGVNACTDGLGDIYLWGNASATILAGNGAATGPSLTTDPGCVASPPAGSGWASCYGSVLTMGSLTYTNTVAGGTGTASAPTTSGYGTPAGNENFFTGNTWSNGMLDFAALDASGPNVADPIDQTSTFVASNNPSTPTSIENSWGSPADTCDPTTAAPQCSS